MVCKWSFEKKYIKNIKKSDKLIIWGGGGCDYKKILFKNPHRIQTQFYVYSIARYLVLSITIVPVTTFIFGGACVIQFSKSNATLMFIQPVLRIKNKQTERQGKGICSFQFSYVIIYKRGLLN